jgi:ribonuclease D
MFSPIITTQDEFVRLCDHIRSEGSVGFDTEFVSESSYQPELCLLQFATKTVAVSVDPLAELDLNPWWEIMLDDKTQVVVHGGREEARFCILHTQQLPQLFYDVQIAQGLLDRGFPLSYSSLVSRNLKKQLNGGETRSDWKRRPLSANQLAYALEDVEYLLPVFEKQRKKLSSLKRTDWVKEECDTLLVEIQRDLNTPPWQKIPGIQKLRPREVVVLEALSNWREEQAMKFNKPRRRILRDDFMVEIARRHPQTREELFNTRGLESSIARRDGEMMVQVIRDALAKAKTDPVALPPKESSNAKPDEHVLGRLLGVALSNRCAELDLSMSLVATNSDLVEFIRWHTEDKEGDTPALATGWRKEVCGSFLSDILEGRVNIRVANAKSDSPLVFEKIKEKETKASKSKSSE